MNIRDDTWSRWNALSGEQRATYIDHARQLVERGYIYPTDNEDAFDIALRCFESHIDNERKNQSPQKERSFSLP